MSGHADRAFKMPTLGATIRAGPSGEISMGSPVFNQGVLLMLEMFFIVYIYIYILKKGNMKIYQLLLGWQG